MPESCVPGQVAGQEISGRCKFLADEAQAEEPGSHRIFGVFVLLGLGAFSFSHYYISIYQT